MRDPTNVATKAADKVFSSADFCNRLYLINNAPSEHHLRPQQHFVEFIVTGSRICTTELRPSVNGVEHQLEMVAFDVIVQPADDRLDVVIACLARIEAFVFPDELKLPARKIISASAIPSAPGPDRSSALGWSFMF